MPAATRKHWRPVLALLFITPILTELLSNNMTFSMLFLPAPFLFLATIGYGFPALLIREWAARRGYGLASLALMGFVYGIWNEGIIAKTLLRSYQLPIDFFDFYGMAYHIAVPWGLMICTWHAMHAVVYPILIVHLFFPEHRDETWLSRRSSVVVALIALGFGLLVYFSRSPEAPEGKLPQLLIFVAVAVLIGLVATWFPKTPQITPGGPFRWSAIRHGFCFFLVAFFIPLMMARYRLPVPVYEIYFVLLIGVSLYFLARKPTLDQRPLLLFMLGDQICLASFGLIGACGMGSYERIAASLMFLTLSLWGVRWLRKSPENSSWTIITWREKRCHSERSE